MAKKRWGCLTGVCTDGVAEWKESTEGGREYIMELGRERGACEGVLVLQTGLAEGCRGDVILGLLLEDAIECERELGPRIRIIPDGTDGVGGTRETSGVGGTLSCKSVTNRQPIRRRGYSRS